MRPADLFRPWLAPLMRQRILCRCMFAAVLALVGASWLGWSLWPCIFARTTALPCPGCGMTRAMMAMLRGDWTTVMRMHPFAPVLALVGGLCVVVSFLPAETAGQIAAKVEAFEKKIPLLAVLPIIFAGFVLLRMLGLCYQDAILDSPPAFWRNGVAPGAIQPQP